MLQIESFNSLWEIAFAINAVFIFFELAPFCEKKFIGANSLGDSVICKVVKEEDQRYVKIYGWKSLLFGYTIWISRLKLLSIINSLLAISLIIIAGFDNSSDISLLLFCVLVAVLFTPIVVIPLLALILIPLYKFYCIKEAIYNLTNREVPDSDELISRNKKYNLIVEYIKRYELTGVFWLKRDGNISDEELFSLMGNG